MTPRSRPEGPASGPPSIPVVRARFIGDTPLEVRAIRRKLIAVAVVVGVLALVLLMNPPRSWPAERRRVSTWYNDALTDGDLSVAYTLGCAADRRDVSLERFRELYTAALRPLGGRLESWGQLRGAVDWHGSSSDRQSSPDIEQVDGHYCVHLGGNPLGD